jgi:hypothetical protein
VAKFSWIIVVSPSAFASAVLGWAQHLDGVDHCSIATSQTVQNLLGDCSVEQGRRYTQDRISYLPWVRRELFYEGLRLVEAALWVLNQSKVSCEVSHDLVRPR